MAENDKKALPAYVSAKGFDVFINSLRDSHIPPRIDRSVLPKASGSQFSAMIAALKFLQLIDQNNAPTPALEQLVKGSEADRAKLLRGVVSRSYAFLQEIDLEKATGHMVAEKFREQGVTGSTLAKAMAFFLAMAKNADLKVSPFIKPPQVPAGSSGRRARALAEDDDEVDEGDESEPADSPGSQRLRLPLPGKQDVVVILPEDFGEEDWKFLKPIFEAYITRLLAG